MKTNTYFLTVASVFFRLPAALSILADEESDDSSFESQHDEERGFHQHQMSVFAGITQESSEHGLSLGIEYERRLSRSFGIGLVAEHTSGDLDFWLYGLPFAFHNGPWKFYLAPGIADGDHATEFLVRVGGEYAIEAGSWEIAPQLDFDFVEGNQAVVPGSTIGKGF